MYPDDLIRIPDTAAAQEQMSEDIYLRQRELGQRAREVLDNEAFQQSYAELRALILVQWEGTTLTQTEVRESLWMQLQAASMFHDNLKATLEAGKVAEANIQLEELKKSRK